MSESLSIIILAVNNLAIGINFDTFSQPFYNYYLKIISCFFVQITKFYTLTYMYMYLFLFQRLVFGDECSNSSPKSRLSLYKDIPSLEQDISSFETSLQAEVKILESSKELLKVKP